MFLKKVPIIFVVIFCFILSTNSYAKPINPLKNTELPTSLKEWVPFVKFGVDEKDYKNPCPYFYNNFNSRICSFPSSAKINVNNKGFSFTQKYQAYDEAFLMLVGGYGLWPQNVKVNNKNVPVVSRNSKPAVFVEDAGSYSITGSVKWEKMPETIEIPEDTVAVELFVDGKKLETPEIDASGKIRLKRKQKVEVKTSDAASIKIFRHIVDDVPMKIETTVVFDISGQDRELVVANPELDGFRTVNIKSPLPIKIEKDGNYRIFAKAGRWQAVITSVSGNSLKNITVKSKTSEGVSTSDEIWTFEARPELRTVQLTGVQSIDPSLTDLPRSKRRYPAYLVRTGDVLTFDEKSRGFDENTPDNLNLSRKLVMNLDGSGYFVKDTISGEINKSSRLEMANGDLGRVSINGISQLITKLDENSKSGVEVRQGRISLNADSRITNDIANIDVTGWDDDFQSVQTSLVLPPGWSLLDAAGVDKVYPTWVGSWSLLDVFVVLVTSVAIYKLMGIPYGLLTVITLTLTHNETSVFSWLLLLSVIFIALEKFLPESFFLKLVSYSKKAVFLILIINIAFFSLKHIRKAIYPSISDFYYGYSRSYDSYGGVHVKSKRVAEVPWATVKQEAGDFGGQGLNMRSGKVLDDGSNMIGRVLTSDDIEMEMPMPMEEFEEVTQEAKAYNLQNMLKDSNVQTGVGVSEWRGKEISLSWNSMVESGHKLKLFFISAKLNLLLSFARVLLLWLLMAVIMFSKERIKNAKDFVTDHILKTSSRLAVLFVLGVIFTVTPLSAAPTEYPSKDMLQELKTRLLPSKEEVPSCFPDCVNLEKVHIDARENSIVIKSKVHIEANDKEKVMFPLPTITGNWRPENIIVNGEVLSPSVYRGKAAFIVLSKGINDVEIIGKMPQSETVQIKFPIESSIVTSSVKGWNIKGINDNQTSDGIVQLIREQKKQTEAVKAEEKYSSPQIKPYMIVERTIDLGISWAVTTTVRTANRASTGDVIKVPLMDGESVTTKGIEIEDGNVIINVTTDKQLFRWSSVLEQKNVIELQSKEDVPFSEVWKINAENIWNVKTYGLPRIQNNNLNSNLMIFKPWAGEKLKLDILRPEAAKGQIKTFDKVKFEVKLSDRNLDANLDMSLRSSLGTQHKIKLPENAKTPIVYINGAKQFSSFEDGYVSFPVVPGTQNIKINWLQPQTIKNLFKLPEVNIGDSAVNISVTAKIPQNRWVLLAGGAAINPIILFWGVLPLIIMLALALGKYPSSIPLKSRHWFLLFLGLSQTHMTSIVFILVWFVFLERRKNNSNEVSRWVFNMRQIFLAILTIIAFKALISGIGSGLLGTPNMQIRGYNSYAYNLGWYQDFSLGELPQVWILSLPIYVWRGLMLLWALWLSFAVTKWVRWAFDCFAADGVWKKKNPFTTEKDS